MSALCFLGLFAWFVSGCQPSLPGSNGMADANPYATGLNQWLAEQHTSDLDNLYPMGSGARSVGRNVLRRAWGLTHPLSELTSQEMVEWHKQEVRKETEYLLTVAENFDGRLLGGGAWNVDRFVMRRLLDAFYRFRRAGLFEDELPGWLERARLPVEYQYDNYWVGEGMEDLPGWNHHAGAYPNSDALYLLMMGLAGELYEEPRYTERAREFVGHMSGCLFPMGGFTYAGSTNELPTYHNVNLTCLARYWQVTGDSAALKLIKNTVEYYPLTFGPLGITERTPYTWFKRHMGYSTGISGLEIVASVTGDGRNYYLLEKVRRHTADIYPVDFWRTDIQPVVPEDNYIRYDPNINGVRGRFGQFSWTGVIGHGAAVDAFAGAQIAEDSRKPSLNAAFELLSHDILLEDSDEILWKRAAFVTGPDFTSDLVIGEEFAALAVSYQLHEAWKEFAGYERQAATTYPWTVNQVWLFLPQKLVGLSVLTSTADQETAGMRTRLRVIPHGSLEQKGDWQFAANNLRLNILAHNHGQVHTGDAANTSQLQINPGRIGSTIYFTQDRTSFRKGESYTLAMEAYPDWADELTGFTVLKQEGLVGFSVTMEEHNYHLAFNPGTNFRGFRLPPGSKAEIHHSYYEPKEVNREEIVSELIKGGTLVVFTE